MEASYLRYYDINRVGWIGITSTLAEMNARLDWCDVQDEEYILIDSDGWLYDARPDDESRWGYRWKRSDRRNVDVKMILQNYVHGEHLSPDELNFIR